MKHKEIEDFLLQFPKVWLDYPFGEGTAVYKYGDKPDGKIVAIVAEDSTPLRVSLKCDPLLAKHLREKYESVLPGYHLNKKHWNTIICSGQLTEEEVFDLARHSYQLVSDTV
ncbi:MAG: MmcQ/YjbR family DNA-binding protein [Candidatus Nomurabacteria bacterium]|nr:MAG: MmcQ/YjbR family DNA-binding protein [Candidatus Nomurabacteria bacterium]